MKAPAGGALVTWPSGMCQLDHAVLCCAVLSCCALCRVLPGMLWMQAQVKVGSVSGGACTAAATAAAAPMTTPLHSKLHAQRFHPAANWHVQASPPSRLLMVFGRQLHCTCRGFASEGVFVCVLPHFDANRC